MELIEAEVEVPALIREAADHLGVREVVDGAIEQLKRAPPGGALLAPVDLVDTVTRQEFQDRRF